MSTPRHLLRRTVWPNSERLERLKRWPGLRRHWEGKQVRIWSNEWEAYWRPDGAGYTPDGLEAGVFDFADAWARTSHAGPEKRIMFRLVLPSETPSPCSLPSARL